MELPLFIDGMKAEKEKEKKELSSHCGVSAAAPKRSVQIFVPRLAALVAESFKGLVPVPIPGTLDLPEGWVLLDPQSCRHWMR